MELLRKREPSVQKMEDPSMSTSQVHDGGMTVWLRVRLSPIVVGAVAWVVLVAGEVDVRDTSARK